MIFGSVVYFDESCDGVTSPHIETETVMGHMYGHGP